MKGVNKNCIHRTNRTFRLLFLSGPNRQQTSFTQTSSHHYDELQSSNGTPSDLQSNTYSHAHSYLTALETSSGGSHPYLRARDARPRYSHLKTPSEPSKGSHSYLRARGAHGSSIDSGIGSQESSTDTVSKACSVEPCYRGTVFAPFSQMKGADYITMSESAYSSAPLGQSSESSADPLRQSSENAYTSRPPLSNESNERGRLHYHQRMRLRTRE